MELFEWLENLCFAIGFIFAPVHELGHVLFGYLSFNPTHIIGWALAQSTRDGWLMSFGGVFTNLVFYAGVSELVGRKSLGIYPWCLSLTVINMMSIPFQTDQIGYEPLMPALWYLTGALCLVFMAFRLAQRSRQALHQARLRERRKLRQQRTIPRDSRAYLDWLNTGG